MAYCKKCDNAKGMIRYYSSDAAQKKVYESNKRWRNANRDKYRTQTLTKSGGLSIDEFNAMLLLQDGLCAICHGPPNGKWNVLQSDHDHQTGLARGLLCARCNLGLGRFKDSLALLKSAIEYLEKHRKA
jgi:hypothetical protein